MQGNKAVLDAVVRPKSRHYTYKLLLLIKKGTYSAKIARQLKEPRQTINDRIKRLIAIGFIKIDVITSAKFYKLTKKGYEWLKAYRCRLSRYPRQNTKTRMHRLNIKFPITKDNKRAKFDRESRLNNWIQGYTTVSFPIGITIKRTPKSIIAMFHEFETKKCKCLTDFFNHILRGSYYVYYYLMKKYGIKIDIFDGIITDQHLVNESPELANKTDLKKTTLISLSRQSKSLFPTELRAKAWLDHSKGLPEIETNDFLYEEKLLRMPETIDELSPVLQDLTEQIKLHLEIQRETLKTLKEMRGYFKNGG